MVDRPVGDAQTPPPDPPPPPPPAQSSNREIMLVLSYIWILALIPLLVEKSDREIQWHAKNGLLLLAVEIVVWIVINIFPLIGCLVAFLFSVAILVVRIIAIVKALRGERLRIPFISDYADQWK